MLERYMEDTTGVDRAVRTSRAAGVPVGGLQQTEPHGQFGNALRPIPDLTAEVRHHFEAEEVRNGYTDASKVAAAIAPDSPLAPVIEREVMRMPTREHMYEGATETVGDLLGAGDHVTVWTQGDPRGQLWKVGSSGIGSLRKSLPRKERRRLSVISSVDKIRDLSELVGRRAAAGLRNIVMVDDKATNIIKAHEAIEAGKADGQIPVDTQLTAVWINQGRTKDHVPPGYTPDTFKDRFLTIENIKQLKEVRAAVREGRDDAVAWLIDFDHTLLHTSGAKDALFQRLAGVIADRIPFTVSPRVDHELGLNGNVRYVRALLSGMSGGQVLHIDTDQESFVVKHNPTSPDRVRREIQGYRILHETPLGKHLLPPTHMSEDLAILALPYQEGIQLRQGVRDGTIAPEIANRVLSDLLQTKKDWWETQDKVHPNGDLVSMQRAEWNDTVERTKEAIQALSQRYGIAPEKFWTLPVESSGQEYPSLISAMRQVHMLLAEYPPYAVLAHNDSSGANIVANPADGSWKLVDAEWAGYGDPAESFVRMIKYVSSTTTTDLGPVTVEERDGKLHVGMDPKFPKAALEIQSQGLAQIKDFSRALSDPDFEVRVREYLAGSYIREMALALKRGNLDMALLAMVNALKAIREV